MTTCCSSALAVSTLNRTHTLSSSRSSKNSQLYRYSNEFFMPSTISKFNLSRRNVFSAFNSVVNNSSLDETYTAVHEVKTGDDARKNQDRVGVRFPKSLHLLVDVPEMNDVRALRPSSLCFGFLTWRWRDYSIRYQYSGVKGPALILVHGFGANSDHWRKNLPVLAHSHRVYSIDLIGYGYSDKPNPRQFGVDYFYTFETWASQLNDFCKDIVKDEAFFICNSIGGLVGLQAAVMDPQICKGIILLNISLRMLHIKKQPWFGRPLIKSFQNLLRNTDLGKMFFKSVATPESVKNILCQCYYDTSQVTDELVQLILDPGREPGAVDVFLEFICYSDGPLPEELLPQVKCPVLIAWGDKDPWEPIELGKAYGQFESVEAFVVLPDVGHCPQDEAPHLVNPLIASFVAKHVPLVASLSSQSHDQRCLIL